MLQGLLDDLRGGHDAPLHLIIEEYGARDSAGGWSKSLPIDFFPWRREQDEGPTFYWASDPAAGPVPLEEAFMHGAQGRGYVVVTDELASWAFCPYWAGVDVIFASTAQRDDFVAAHMPLRPKNAMGL